jgi:mono/diheme cytochrome c family protein
VPTDGSGIYGVFCSVCHGVDGRGGKYKVITGASTSFVTRALDNVNLMSSLSLSSSQVSNVAGYLAAGGGGSKPTTGSGLFHVYCETCHGPNGSGGPEERISGASQGSINSALSGESAMHHLVPYLTTSGSSSDTALIAGFLGGSSGGGD